MTAGAAFTVTAWKNGSGQNATGYGFKISIADRNRYFGREWKQATLVFPDRAAPIIVNLDKASFWTPMCRELISKELGDWMADKGLLPWPKGSPPKFSMRLAGTAVFEVSLQDPSATQPGKHR